MEREPRRWARAVERLSWWGVISRRILEGGKVVDEEYVMIDEAVSGVSEVENMEVVQGSR